MESPLIDTSELTYAHTYVHSEVLTVGYKTTQQAAMLICDNLTKHLTCIRTSSGWGG